MSDNTPTRDKLPRPSGPVVPSKDVKTFDEATNYLCAQYHSCLDRAEHAEGAEQRLWHSAALSYLGAFLGIPGLKILPGGAGLATTLGQIGDGDKLAKEAGGGEKLTHDKMPRPSGKVVPFTKVDTFDEAVDYIFGAYHACVDKLEHAKGDAAGAWHAAALAYFGAYMGVAGLKVLPGNAGLAVTREQISDANHKADLAAAIK